MKLNIERDVKIENNEFDYLLPFNISRTDKVWSEINKQFYQLISQSFTIISVGTTQNLYQEAELNEVPNNVMSISDEILPEGISKIERRDTKASKLLSSKYKYIIDQLSLKYKVFLSNWNFIDKWRDTMIPDWYIGDIYKRSGEDLSFFLEWDKDIDMTYHQFWTYGAWCIAMKKSADFGEWVNKDSYDVNLVKNFVSEIGFIFKLVGEFDRLLMVLLNDDYNEIVKLFEVK